MSLLSLFSMKSMVSLLVLLVAVGIGSFLYLTLDTDFEAQPRLLMSRSAGSDLLNSPIPIDDIKQIINSARQAWSIVDQK